LKRGYNVLPLMRITYHDFSAVWKVALLPYRLSYRGSTSKSAFFVLRAVTTPFQLDVHVATDVLIRKETHFSVKVKCTLVQALRLCTGRTAHRGSRNIALLFLDQRH